MTALIVELPPDVYARMREKAERQGKSLEGAAKEVLTEWVDPSGAAPVEEARPTPDREHVRAALRAAGLLVEPTPEQIAWAETVDVTLDEVIAALDQSEGKPLSEIVLEMRGPKE